MRYSSDSGMGSGMFLLGAVTGAVVGAGIALLVAPKTGAETRQELGASLSSFRQAAVRRYRELAARAGVEFENLEEKADQLADQFESSARDVLESASSKLHEASARVREGASGVRHS
jgi:gas vesicle protein